MPAHCLNNIQFLYCTHIRVIQSFVMPIPAAILFVRRFSYCHDPAFYTLPQNKVLLFNPLNQYDLFEVFSRLISEC